MWEGVLSVLVSSAPKLNITLHYFVELNTTCYKGNHVNYKTKNLYVLYNKQILGIRCT